MSGSASEAGKAFARQALRTALVEDWLDALGVTAGDRVADIGCGAGYVSLRLAQRVGRDGAVIAIDHKADSLAFLSALSDLHGLACVRIQEADLHALPALLPPPRVAICSMVLHHVRRTADALTAIHRALPGTPLLVAEFDRQGPCRVGPPRSMRLSVDDLRAAADGAGYRFGEPVNQTAEHWYALLAS